MGAKNNNSSSRIFMFYVLLISLSFLCLFIVFKPLFLLNLNSPSIIEIRYTLPVTVHRNPKWLRLIRNYFPVNKKKIRVGFLNMDEDENEDEAIETKTGSEGSLLSVLSEELVLENVQVSLDPLPSNLTWKSLFPVWIDEDHTWHKPSCPEIPLPKVEGSTDVDVIVVKLPCDGYSEKRGLRDVFRLQVNLAAANLAVESGRRDGDRTVYVVFIGSCGPMHEIFRCDERVKRVGEYWVYRPDLRRLRQKLLMPFGSCQIAKPVHQLDQAPSKLDKNKTLTPKTTLPLSHVPQRVAYVTLLHSSEVYVCGAIALAQSIRQSGSTQDMLLLHDDSITNRSLTGLSLAGWKLRRIKRIRSPFSKKGSYNEWNYSKLRVWQVTEYDKLVFIDADFIIFKNVDYLFSYPQLSASGNNKVLFNSGIMVLEPSACLFEDMMLKSSKIKSYNGGDQGFLNEYFVWWHRLTKRLNTMKYFGDESNKGKARDLPENIEGIHYLGLKPWRCYRDYDCNWDLKTRRVYASDSVHERWWKVYDKMEKKLKGYCGLSVKMEKNVEKWRKMAKVSGFPEKHWKVRIKDPRKKNLINQ